MSRNYRRDQSQPRHESRQEEFNNNRQKKDPQKIRYVDECFLCREKHRIPASWHRTQDERSKIFQERYRTLLHEFYDQSPLPCLPYQGIPLLRQTHNAEGKFNSTNASLPKYLVYSPAYSPILVPQAVANYAWATHEDGGLDIDHEGTTFPNYTDVEWDHFKTSRVTLRPKLPHNMFLQLTPTSNSILDETEEWSPFSDCIWYYMHPAIQSHRAPKVQHLVDATVYYTRLSSGDNGDMVRLVWGDEDPLSPFWQQEFQYQNLMWPSRAHAIESERLRVQCPQRFPNLKTARDLLVCRVLLPRQLAPTVDLLIEKFGDNNRLWHIHGAGITFQVMFSALQYDGAFFLSMMDLRCSCFKLKAPVDQPQYDQFWGCPGNRYGEMLHVLQTEMRGHIRDLRHFSMKPSSIPGNALIRDFPNGLQPNMRNFLNSLDKWYEYYDFSSGQIRNPLRVAAPADQTPPIPAEPTVTPRANAFTPYPPNLVNPLPAGPEKICYAQPTHEAPPITTYPALPAADLGVELNSRPETRMDDTTASAPTSPAPTMFVRVQNPVFQVPRVIPATTTRATTSTPMPQVDRLMLTSPPQPVPPGPSSPAPLQFSPVHHDEDAILDTQPDLASSRSHSPTPTLSLGDTLTMKMDQN